MLRFTLVFSLIIFSCLSCKAQDIKVKNESREESVFISPLNNEEADSIIINPDRVESYRIEPRSYAKDLSSNAVTYDVIKTGPILNKEQIVTLHQMILSPKKIDLDPTKPYEPYYVETYECEFSPGYVLKFIKGDQEVTMLVCLGCNEWEFNYKILSHREYFDQVGGPGAKIVSSFFKSIFSEK